LLVTREPTWLCKFSTALPVKNSRICQQNAIPIILPWGSKALAMDFKNEQYSAGNGELSKSMAVSNYLLVAIEPILT